ncbi:MULTISPECIES: energy-coupling factor transporter transmembrane component T family protein [Prochlorococcus]|uniref:energy-coupling factor transporter transmembrane component T family protein n=1 Tax=Prochlorococcus TaxID=1218 RepID=UPI000533BCDA|nr:MULTISPECIES: CbiQ family ECF transporter T component [Prochlorococcus]KGG13007.1 transmembrane component of ECF transporter energizing module [Prochlorococcus sp. MIT 0601]
MDFLKKLPIGQFVAGDSGWLRRFDPRLKFAWVMMFLVTPVLAGTIWRVGLVLFLLIITCFSAIPLRVWGRSVVYLSIFSIFLGFFAIFLPTSEALTSLPLRSYSEIPNTIADGPSWELFKLGPLLIDRRSFDLGIKTSSLVFTVVHSVNLMLLTTSPEELVWTLSWLMRPLGILGFPVERLSFQLLLALRFLPLVQEELQSLLRALSTRAVNFRKLGLKGSVNVFLTMGERFLANILLRADQGAEAFFVRTGGKILTPDHLKPETIKNSSYFLINSTAALFLILAISLRFKLGSL